MGKWVIGLVALGLVGACVPANAQKKPAVLHKDLVYVGVPAGRMVTWGYLRTHHPELLPKMLASANPKLLADFGSPALLSLVRGFAASNPKRFTERRVKTGGGSSITEPSVGNYGDLMSLHTPPDVTPASVDFGKAWDKQAINVKLHVVPSADGTLSVTLADPNQPFKITRLVVFSGICLPSKGGGAKGNGAILAQFDANETQAPFTAPVMAGADVEVDLAFDPVLNLPKVGPGTYNDTLIVNAGTGPTRVPMSGFIEGKSIGVQTVLDDYQPQVLAGGGVNSCQVNGHVTNDSSKPALVSFKASTPTPGAFAGITYSVNSTSSGVNLAPGQSIGITLTVTWSTNEANAINAQNIVAGTPVVPVMVQETDNLGGNFTIGIPVHLSWVAQMWQTSNAAEAKANSAINYCEGEFILWPTGDYAISGFASALTTTGVNGTPIANFTFHSVGQDIVLGIPWGPEGPVPIGFQFKDEASGNRPDFAANLASVINGGSLFITLVYF